MSTVAGAIRCPRCGTLQPPTLDFCDADLDGERCLQYLAWLRPPGEGAPAEPPQAPPQAPPEPTVRMDVEFPDAGGLTPGVTPGDRVKLEVTLRNVGRIVDEFIVSVQGLPDGWVQPPTGALYLVPIGHDGDVEGRLSFVLAPPRDSTALAGTYPITIAALSASRERILATASATLVVRPFHAVTATARPQIARGRTRVRFLVDVRNNGNTAITPTLVPSDGEELTFATPSGLTAIEPGRALSLPLIVRAKRLLIGQPKDRPLQVVVAVNGNDPPAPPLPLIFRQVPLIPWWVPIALTTLAALAIALYAIWPHKVTMPVVKSQTVFVAERRLERAGFKTKPKVVTRVRSNVKQGTILDQTPQPYARVTPDTPVVLRVAVPATFTIIPDITGRTVGEAEEFLNRRYLKLGKVVPADAPATRTIASQVPLPGRARSRDITAVDVVLAPPGKVPVPDIRCKTLTQIEKILTHSGFVLGTVSSSVTSSQVATDQVPAPKTKRPLGSSVMARDFEQSPKQCQPKSSSKSSKKTTGSTTTGSAGATTTTASAAPARSGGSAGAGNAAPSTAEPVAFDDGRTVRLATTGAALATGRQPAWSPDGALLATRVGSDLRISSTAAAGTTTTVRVGRDVLSAPAFAMADAGADPLLAFLATSANGASRLCLTRVTGAAPPPTCTALRRLRARSVAWSPGGSMILVVGARPGDEQHPGVVRVQRTGGDPASASSWSVGSLLWRLRLPGGTAPIFAAAYDPRADRLALVTSRAPAGGRPAPQVALLDLAAWPNLRHARWIAGGACQVAWSPTGARLAVVAAPARGACPAEPATGPLETFAALSPERRTTVAQEARNPAWQP